MTPTELRGLCETRTSVSLLTALEAVGVGETAGRKALRDGTLPFPVVRVGRALRVPTGPLAALLLGPLPQDVAGS
jgi:hypothetical protein